MEDNVLEMSIDNLLALSHIVERFDHSYDIFNEKIIKLIKSSNCTTVLHKFYKIYADLFCLNAKKEKKFYHEFSGFIKIIREYSDLDEFIYNGYRNNGDVIPAFYNFYQYLLQHKGDIKEIIETLHKFKEIGIDRVEVTEDEDFSKDTYTYNKDTQLYNINGYDVDDTSNLVFYHGIIYLDNLEIMPSYDFNEETIYKSRKSDYKIFASIGINDIVTITVNNLTFDLSRLPEKTSVGALGQKLSDLCKEQELKCKAIKNSVDLDIQTNELNSQIYSISETVNSLNDTKTKNEMIKILSDINLNLQQLTKLNSEYDESIIGEISAITPELLQNEKSAYMKQLQKRKENISWQRRGQ